jgi:hypothetical protein
MSDDAPREKAAAPQSMAAVPYVSPAGLTRVEEGLRREITALREWFDRELMLRDKALELQAKEYERRLEVLNHAHAAAVEAQAKTVPREMYDSDRKGQEQALATALVEQRRTFDAYKAAQDDTEGERSKAFQIWKDEINAKLASQAGAAAASAKTWALIMAVGAILVNLVIRYMTSTK